MTRAAITVLRPPDEVERLWREWEHVPGPVRDAATFAAAPGDRGTEIHVRLGERAGGPVGNAIKKIASAQPEAKAKDALQHFKQWVETGVITRSDGSPEGERAERKRKQRPAQPLSDDEL